MSLERGANRLLKYIKGLEKAIEEAEKNLKEKDKTSEILNLVKAYLRDTKYYYEVKDYETGFITIAYAEGLLDALRYLKLTDFKWERKPEIPNVVVGGTFDLIHPGHIKFLEEASKYGKVHVIIARDKNVAKFKGRPPINTEVHRLETVRGIKYVYNAVLGDENDFIKPLLKIKPKYVILGPDQEFNEIELKNSLKAKGLECEVIRIKKRFNVGISSTSEIIKRIIKLYKKN